MLVRAAEERVGRAADAQPLRLGQRLQRQPVLERQDQRLFGIDVLAGLERGLADREMRVGDRQVDDEVDFRVREQLLDGLGADAVFLRAGFGRRRIDVGAGPHLEAAEQRREAEIGGRDIAASDDADADRVHGSAFFKGKVCCFAGRVRRQAQRRRIRFADLSVDKSARACLPLGRRVPRQPRQARADCRGRPRPGAPRPARSRASADGPARRFRVARAGPQGTDAPVTAPAPPPATASRSARRRRGCRAPSRSSSPASPSAPPSGPSSRRRPRRHRPSHPRLRSAPRGRCP